MPSTATRHRDTQSTQGPNTHIMKKAFITLALIIVSAFPAKADEGMWMLTMLDKLNIKTMQEMGCKLTAEDIYSINNNSIKDAVIIFGGGCTGEIVSENGLIFTNHHCGYESIQKLSSVEHNYLKNGFWSKSFEEDLPVDGLKVKFVKRIEEYTDSVLAGTTENMAFSKRDEVIADNIDKIEKALNSAADEYHQFMIESFFGGNQYFLIEYEVYKDIRLVGTPPESIGKFGHDTDNWMWPRHTGDFSIFRVYADKDGKPSNFSNNNKPLKPKHFLPVSIKGVKQGDFAMTMGFPGSTDRYLTSFGIKNRMDIVNQAMIGPRGVKQDIWLASMHASEKVNIQYASKYARSTNYWKNSIGMNNGLERLDVVAQKETLESDFETWVKADKDREARYGKVLEALRNAYDKYAPICKAQRYLYECQLSGPEVFRFAMSFFSLETALKNNNEKNIATLTNSLKETARQFYKDYDAATDKKVIAALGEFYSQNIDKAYWPDYFNVVNKKYKASFDKYSEDIYSKSIFADSTKLMKFLNKPSYKTLSKDIAFTAAKALQALWSELYYSSTDITTDIDNYNRLFIKGLMEMQQDKVFYSDANFTIRLSYGSVGDYESRDAVHYKHFTTLKGVMEKEDPNNWEFVVSPKLKELYNNKDFGRYADEDGTMHVCFTTNNDITGGNSGSPVINGNGELIGLAFDGNWEAMSGDIAFETELQKCICVDIRYVLFIIEKYGEAKNIIDELKIVD